MRLAAWVAAARDEGQTGGLRCGQRRPTEGARRPKCTHQLNAINTPHTHTHTHTLLSFHRHPPPPNRNLELDSLRGDLGLLGYPPKDLHHRFLARFRPVFFLRPRDYSKSVPVAPFIVNYSGALFREFPGPWQVRGWWWCLGAGGGRWGLFSKMGCWHGWCRVGGGGGGGGDGEGVA